MASHKVAALFTYYIYSGTSIKRTPLGTSLLAVIERWSFLGGFNCQLSTSHFLLQMNLRALLTASLAYISFEKAVETSHR